MTNPINIMVERDFCRLEALTKGDIVLLQQLMVERTKPHFIRELHENLLQIFARVAQINDWLQSNPRASAADKGYVKSIVIEAEERLHSTVEQGAADILQALMAQDKQLFFSDDTALQLIHYLSVQYFRTRNMRMRVQKSGEGLPLPGDIGRIANLICQFAAANVGYSLYLGRNDYELVYLESPDGTEFITGDQPVVNALAQGDDAPPEQLAFYYPVCPDLAILLAPKSLQLSELTTAFDVATQTEFNDLMAWHSDTTIISKSSEMLRKYQTGARSDWSAPPPCIGSRLTQVGSFG